MEQVIYTIYAHFECKPETIYRVQSILLSLVDLTRQEEGCLKYDLYFSRENPEKILLHEHWKNEQAHDLHMNMPYIVAWQKQKKDLLAHFYDASLLKKCLGEQYP